jgi:hypothetical protein
MFASLTGLSHLRDLSIGPWSLLAEHDAVHLTALTSLTRLVLAGAGRGVGDFAASAIAYKLKQLRHLDLSRCEISSTMCLAAIGQLHQLTALQLEGNDKLPVQQLTMLTGLAHLRQLGVTRSRRADQLLWGFWLAVRQP